VWRNGMAGTKEKSTRGQSEIAAADSLSMNAHCLFWEVEEEMVASGRYGREYGEAASVGAAKRPDSFWYADCLRRVSCDTGEWNAGYR
jgi:hypothetical protein